MQENIFRLKKRKKETNDVTIKSIRNLFRLKKENKATKCRVQVTSEHEEEDYYKPIRVDNFWADNYIEYKGKGGRKMLSVKKILNKIRPYLKLS